MAIGKPAAGLSKAEQVGKAAAKAPTTANGASRSAHAAPAVKEKAAAKKPAPAAKPKAEKKPKAGDWKLVSREKDGSPEKVEGASPSRSGCAALARKAGVRKTSTRTWAKGKDGREYIMREV